MKINKVEISEKLKNLKSISSPKIPNQPQGILLKDGSIWANNLQTAMQAKLSVNTEESFIIPLDAIAFIERLPNAEIEITCNTNNRVEIKCGSIEGKFSSIDASSFPEAKTMVIGETPDVRLPSSDIEKCINQIVYACPNEATKPIFKGICFDGNGKQLNLVACDGYRIALNKIATTQKVDVVIPKEAMQKALSVLDKNEDLLIYTDKKIVVMQSGDYTVFAQLYAGTYIDYRKAFPKESVAKFSINKQALIDCLQRSIICNGNEKNACGILNGKKDNSEIVFTNRSNLNAFTENLTIDCNLAVDIEIGFNSRYMLEAAKASDEDTLIIQYAGPLAPLMICDTSLRQMLLPVKLR